MKLSIPRFHCSAILALLTIVWLALPQLARPADLLARVPHNAFNKSARPDLDAPLRAQGEIHVVVGLQTPDEITRSVDTTPDTQKLSQVAARQSRLLQRLAGYNLRNVRRLQYHHFVAMTVDRSGLNALLADPEVTSVTEDRPNYPVLYDTPGITRADKAWAAGFRGAGQTVAIIDTGVDKTHPFFSGKVVAEACYSKAVGSNTSYCPGGVAQSTAPGSGVPCPDYDLVCWHGTHVAGIATGRTGVLTATTGGMAPDAGLIPIQVFQRTCSGTTCSIAAYDSDILLALDHVYSLRSTYNIASVNMSLGGDFYTASCDTSIPAYKTVIDNLRSVNIATVIAAGNNGNAGGLTAPGCISTAVSVGSTTKANAISSFSNSASFLSLLAPGSSITSSLPLAYASSGFGVASGTSMATPHVAGAWAVLKSAKPTATVSEVLTALQNTGVPITDPRNGIVKSLIQIGNSGTQNGALGVLLGHSSPSVAITAPADGSNFVPAPANITVTATASATGASISRVEFFQGSTKIGEALAAPYSIAWGNVPQGSYTLTALATDTLGGTTTSAPVNISVNPASVTTFQISGTISFGNTALADVILSAPNAACTSTDGAGHYTCTVSQGWTGTVTPSLTGYAFTPISRSYSNVSANQLAQDYGATAATVWFDDALPGGAVAAGDSESWSWVNTNPTPYSGSLAHQSATVSGVHQHYFYSATTTLSVAAGDRLFAYVYLDPANPPSEVMLQWNDGNWEHRAYWGANLQAWGVDGTASRQFMGPLPALGQWVRLEVPAALVGLEGHTLNGMAFTLYNGRATWDYAGKVPGSVATVWFDDALPGGAVAGGDSESWSWVNTNPTPYSGSLAHQSATVSGVHQHYFYSATTTLSVAAGDRLFAYVYLDPANPPSEVMLQWNDGNWEHRAYWGANLQAWGVDGTASRQFMGPLPALGQWVRLEVPAALVGLEGHTLNGMAFTLYNGRATWDYAGKVPGSVATVWFDDALPGGAVAAGDSESWSWVNTNPTPYSGSLAHQSATVSGVHQHYFYSATTTLSVAAGDRLFAYVYLDPANPPSEVMLQWNDGNWEHRAYWGANLQAWGVDGTASRQFMGPLPALGQWVRLEVPAALVGLEGHTLNGMAFTLYNGRATWDYAGK